MKLLRFDDNGTARVGALEGDRIVVLSAPTMTAIITGGDAALAQAAAEAKAAARTVPLAGAKLLAPVERPGKYLAIGMNYAKHIEEAKKLGASAPTNQFWFNKQTTCVAGPFDEIQPGVTQALDYEAELGVVIGRPAKGVSEADAKSHVFGYLVANDVSARDWQRHSPTFTMGKSFDTHGPIGPWIVTAAEFPKPGDVVRCEVDAIGAIENRVAG